MVTLHLLRDYPPPICSSGCRSNQVIATTHRYIKTLIFIVNKHSHRLTMHNISTWLDMFFFLITKINKQRQVLRRNCQLQPLKWQLAIGLGTKQVTLGILAGSRPLLPPPPLWIRQCSHKSWIFCGRGFSFMVEDERHNCAVVVDTNICQSFDYALYFASTTHCISLQWRTIISLATKTTSYFIRKCLYLLKLSCSCQSLSLPPATHNATAAVSKPPCGRPADQLTTNGNSSTCRACARNLNCRWAPGWVNAEYTGGKRRVSSG